MDNSQLVHQFTYHQPSPDAVKKMHVLRRLALELATTINAYMPDCADKSAALRKLREAVMTANAGVVLSDALDTLPHDLSQG